MNGQNQDIETSTDLTQNDSTKHIPESSTDAQITCKPVTQPPSMQIDTSSTLDSNNPTAENIPKKESDYARGGKYNLRPNPNPNHSEIYRCCVQNFILAPFCVSFCSPFLLFIFIFCTHINYFFSFYLFGAYTKLPRTSTKPNPLNKKQQTI